MRVLVRVPVLIVNTFDLFINFCAEPPGGTERYDSCGSPRVSKGAVLLQSKIQNPNLVLKPSLHHRFGQDYCLVAFRPG
jgi:hypothetical protein